MFLLLSRAVIASLGFFTYVSSTLHIQVQLYIGMYIDHIFHVFIYFFLTHLCRTVRSTFAVRETASLGQQMLTAPVGINGLI